MEIRIPPVLITLALICFVLAQNTKAVNPPPDGGYPGNNTAEGQNALLSLTTGVNNTAVGWFSLKSNTNAQLNTAVGAATLFSTVHASRNTAIGGAALFSDTEGSGNTAVGALALFSNTTGERNAATGDSALFNNITGDFNTAIGYSALFNNTIGGENTANGYKALVNNTTGGGNTAIGGLALWANTTGTSNTGVGEGALYRNGTGSANTAVGVDAGGAGDFNTLLGFRAGYEIGGSNNIVIGADVYGVPGDNNTIRIGNTDTTNAFISGINGTTVPNGAPVFVDSSGHLGTLTSSKRFKEEIRPMNKTSEAIFSLEPVTFRYRKDIDPTGTSQFGLIAEEVAKVNPMLVLPDKEGKPYTVRYEAVNAMLLNEFLKEHRTVQELKTNAAKQNTIIAQQQKQIEALTAGLQKVDAQIRLNRPASQVVAQEQ